MPSDLLVDLLAGSIGGASGVLAGHPLDTVKVRLQTQSAISPHYRGTVHCFHCIVAREGAAGLYKGMSSPLASLALINAIVFSVHAQAAKQFQDQMALSTHFLAGAAAGSAQAFVACPMELLKLRAQLHAQQQQPVAGHQQQAAMSPFQWLRHIVREKGIRHLSRGLLATQLRDCPAMGVYFASYEFLTRQMSSRGSKNDNTKEENDEDNARPLLSSWQLLLAGGGAGMLSWLSNYPVDVVKTRFQADDSAANYREVIRKAYSEGGPRVFFAGLGSTLARAFPTNAATFFAVEWTYRLLLPPRRHNWRNNGDQQQQQQCTEAGVGHHLLLDDVHGGRGGGRLSSLLLGEAGCTLLEPLLS